MSTAPGHRGGPRPFSPGFRVEVLTEREVMELKSKNQDPLDYVGLEIAPAEMNLAMEGDGCVVAFILIRLPPGSALDIKPPRIITQRQQQTDPLGLGNSSNPFRIVVRKSTVTKPARLAYPAHFPDEKPVEEVVGEDPTFEVGEVDAAGLRPGGLLGSLLGGTEK